MKHRAIERPTYASQATIFAKRSSSQQVSRVRVFPSKKTTASPKLRQPRSLRPHRKKAAHPAEITSDHPTTLQLTELRQVHSTNLVGDEKRKLRETPPPSMQSAPPAGCCPSAKNSQKSAAARSAPPIAAIRPPSEAASTRCYRPWPRANHSPRTRVKFRCYETPPPPCPRPAVAHRSPPHGSPRLPPNRRASRPSPPSETTGAFQLREQTICQ